MLRLWDRRMKLLRSASVPGRRPPSRPEQLGGPPDGPEVDVVGAEGEVVLRIAGAGVNQRRRPGDRFRHQGPVEADARDAAFHLRPGLAQDLAGLGQEEVHPDLLEHLHGGLMDRLDLLGGDDLHRRIGIGEPAPRSCTKAAFWRPRTRLLRRPAGRASFIPAL